MWIYTHIHTYRDKYKFYSILRICDTKGLRSRVTKINIMVSACLLVIHFSKDIATEALSVDTHSKNEI